MAIREIEAREILDSRGNPTVEATVILDDESTGVAAVPSGASTGTHEALELRDGDARRYGGKGVLGACEHVQRELRGALIGQSVDDLRALDQRMIEVDGTPNKSRLGANAILSVSLAVARAAAVRAGEPLYHFLARQFGFNSDSFVLPVPMCNVLNGGKHADSGLDVQEFMICPVGAKRFSEGIQMAVETFHALQSLLAKSGHSTAVGDEGGFAPKLKDSAEAFEFLLRAIEKAGYVPGDDIALACDVASSEFFDASSGLYMFEGEKRSFEEMLDVYSEWLSQYPLVSVEDPLEQDDWKGWTTANAKFGVKVQIVGDDFLVTNVERLRRAITEKCANSILIKVNQIGTLSEAFDAITMAHDAGWTSFVSHRSGETADTFIADLVVASHSGQIKAGSLSRSDRVEKYNRLLAIENDCERRHIPFEYRWSRSSF